MAVRNVTVRLYDEARNWGQTLRDYAITIDDETGEIADIYYGSGWWRWRNTDSVAGEDIYVFVPRPND